jgi:hypothetical protein
MASLAAERDRRQKAKLAAAGGDPREWLIAKLDEMAARLQEAADYAPPTPAEAAAAEREIEAFFERSATSQTT